MKAYNFEVIMKNDEVSKYRVLGEKARDASLRIEKANRDVKTIKINGKKA